MYGIIKTNIFDAFPLSAKITFTIHFSIQKNQRKLEQTSHFHHICIYPRLESVRQFCLSKIAVSNMKKIFRIICKNSAISDVIFYQGANRYISYLMATLLQNKKTIQHNWKIKILNLKSYLFYGFVSLVTTIMKLSPFFIIPGNLPNKKKRFL